MDREFFVKRVPLDFDWPVDHVWHGYVNPWPGPITCPSCLGVGLNAASRKLFNTFRSWAPKMTKEEEHLLLERGPTPAEIARVRRRSPNFDTPILRFLLVEIRGRRKGTWGPCPECAGKEVIANPNPAVKRLYSGVDLYEEWEPIEPPRGEGWQLWEQAPPDGRPISPVLLDPETLARWCAKKFRTDEGAWLAWILRAGEPEPDLNVLVNSKGSIGLLN